MYFFSNQLIIHYKKPLGKANLHRKKEARKTGFPKRNGRNMGVYARGKTYRFAATKALTARTGIVQNSM